MKGAPFHLGKIPTIAMFVFLLYAITNAVASTFISAADPRIFQSPEVWIQGQDASLETNTPGAYLKFAFTGNSIAVQVDTSNNATELPKLGIQIDSGTVRNIPILNRGSNVNVLLATETDLNPAIQVHQIRVSLEGLGRDNRWIPSSGSLKIDSLKIIGFTLDAGKQIQEPNLRSKRMVVYGDSITEGARMLGGDDLVDDKEWSTTWESVLSDLIGAEVGSVGYQGEGFEVSGGGGVPGLLDAFSWIRSETPRVFSRPDYVFIAHGANGAPTIAEIDQMLVTVRSQYPFSKIFLCVPFGGYARAVITQAYSAQNDSGVYLVDLGDQATQAVLQNSVDQLHPNPNGNKIIAGLMQSKLTSILGRAP